MRRSKRAAAQSAKKMQADKLTQRDAAPVPARNVNDADAVEAAELNEAEPETSSEQEPSSHGAAEESLTAEQHSEEEPELDAFEEDTRAAVDALQEAVTEPAAFLRPSREISELARQAARVSERPICFPNQAACTPSAILPHATLAQHPLQMCSLCSCIQHELQTLH